MVRLGWWFWSCSPYWYLLASVVGSGLTWDETEDSGRPKATPTAISPESGGEWLEHAKCSLRLTFLWRGHDAVSLSYSSVIQNGACVVCVCVRSCGVCVAIHVQLEEVQGIPPEWLVPEHFPPPGGRGWLHSGVWTELLFPGNSAI